MRKYIAFVFRIFTLPFFIGFMSIGLVLKLLILCYYYLGYGGEFMAYEKGDRIMIAEIFREIKSQRKETTK